MKINENIDWQNDKPILVDVIENNESIELVFKEPAWKGFTRTYAVFKTVFSCKNGKWHKSKKIYGEIIEATAESYRFY